MATANIKITALSDITSANMTYQDLVAVVDMNGTPETKKANIQLVGNLILNSAGGSYFPAAAQAVLAQSVTNAAQPNITSTGTLTSLAVTGNVVAGNMQTGAMTATYFVGDGANLTNVPAGIPAGDGGNLSNLAGANVTGEVAFAAVANSIAVANVSGIGNVALVNLDGNVSNILHGDGTWSADATDYSNANVTSLLAAFGSNTISTTGLITGDGGGLSNVPYANVTGTPTLGNVSTVNLDGNASNILHGDGTWSADATDYSNANVVSLLAAFGSNTITTTGLVTADLGGGSNVIGANVTGEVSFAATANAVAYANVSGTPTLGNISTIDLDGNASNVLRGDGTFGADANSSYGDSNVVTLLNAFGSNTITTTGLVTADGGGISNVPYANVTGTPTLGNISTIDIDGSASNVLYGNGVFAAAASPALTGDGYQIANLTGANVTGEVSFAATANAVALANVSGAGNIASIDIDGAAGNVLYGNGVFAAAPGGGSYGDSNVVTLLNAFGSNTITTTGLITGDGGGLSNIAGANVSGTINTAVLAQEVINSAQPNIGSVGTLSELLVSNTIVSVGLTANTGDITVTAGVFAGDGGSISNVVGANVSGEVGFAAVANSVAYANVTGTPTLGNISTIDIDGSASNVLYGNGVFAPATSPALTGDGYQLSNLTGANVSGTVSFADTANNVAIANVFGAGNIATVNLDGNTANYLDGTGSWGPVTATSATTAGTVTTAAQPNITSLGTLVDLTVTGNIAGANINANTNGFSIGYLEIPQVALTANDTIALEDSGKHFRSTTAGNITLSIPTNATVAFPVGTAISIVEQAAGNILVNAISGVTLYQAGNSTAGNRVISTYGVATLMKVDTDTWFISGTGVS